MKYMDIVKEPIKATSFDDFEEFKRDGLYVECPCCHTRHNQIYKRSIYKSLIKGLKALSVRSREITTSSIGDFAKLRYWGLIKETEHEGVWTITDDGHAFLYGAISVPKYVFVQNNVVVGKSDERVFAYEICD